MIFVCVHLRIWRFQRSAVNTPLCSSTRPSSRANGISVVKWCASSRPLVQGRARLRPAHPPHRWEFDRPRWEWCSVLKLMWWFEMFVCRSRAPRAALSSSVTAASVCLSQLTASQAGSSTCRRPWACPPARPPKGNTTYMIQMLISQLHQTVTQ